MKLKAATAHEKSQWIAALNRAISSAVWTGAEAPQKRGVASRIGSQLEKAFNVDLDGDGAVGYAESTLSIEMQKAQHQNTVLRSTLSSRGYDPDASLASIPRDLAIQREHTFQSGRRVMDEIIDTFMEKAMQRVHKDDRLNLLEANVKEGARNRTGNLITAADIKLDWSGSPPIPLGRSLLKYFKVNGIYLNAAALPVTPSIVRDARSLWEAEIQNDPVMFRFKSLAFRENQAANKLASVVKADPTDLTLIINGQMGMASVLKSQPWAAGDRIIVVAGGSAAQQATAMHVAYERGLEVSEVPVTFPTTDEDMLHAFENCFSSMIGSLPKIAFLPHVMGSTGFVLPIKQLTKLCHSYKCAVCVDGTLAVGNVPINIGNLAADYYIGSADRFLFSPQGVSFLVVAPHKQSAVSPLTVSYFAGDGYGKEFSYTGLQDFSTYVGCIQGLDFVDKVCSGLENISHYCNNLAANAAGLLQSRWRTEALAVSPQSRIIVVPVPNGAGATLNSAIALMTHLLLVHNISVSCRVVTLRGVPTLTVRLTLSPFNDMQDVEALADAVLRIGGDYTRLPAPPGEFQLDSIYAMMD
eukprot:NODE_277_length_2542_cov_26.989972_g255_i0.p1 GENE.NODE_277_length_2542_cov_26.989972_g255_i0~~NODE_277_length_2542_cov_26.989972_g255_i0.p1  ORF type:complete len:583 (-),score=94.19 NODE_277_length_2542_cov_26.989972_g255_i0:531-2279(-)